MIYFLIQVSFGLIRYYCLLVALGILFIIPIILFAPVLVEPVSFLEKYLFNIILLAPFVIAVLLWFSGFWERYVRWSLNCRPLLKNERDRLNPLYDSVREKAEAFSSDNFSAVQLFINDDPSANAFALGRKTISLTSGLIDRHSDDEIMAVIAHEFGHLAHGDTTRNVIAYGLESGAVFTERLALRFLVLTKIPIIGYAISIFLLPYLAIRYLIAGLDHIVILIGSYMSRKQEFAADKFAYDLGYGQSLYNFLTGLKDQVKPEDGYLARLQQTHPAPGLRLLKLEGLEAKSGG